MHKALTQWKFYLRPDDVWEAMLKDCAAAKRSIDIEQYIFFNDKIGERFIKILKKKARDGVKVRLLCDAIGSATAFNLFDKWYTDEENFDVEFFNPVKSWLLPYKLPKFFLRDHKKLLVVDGTIGYTGGVGIQVKMSGWRDTHVRMLGPVVGEMQRAFDEMWEVAAQKRRLLKFAHPGLKDGFQFLTNAPRRNQRFIYENLISAIRSAEKYIYLTTPYFIPDHRLLRVLRLAVRRRVDVKLLIPERSDVGLVDIAARSFFHAALKGGIRVHLYRGPTLHAKTGVIDDKWGTIGSANLDNFSLRFNYEGNLVSRDEKFNLEMKQQFLNDIRQSRELLRSEWNQRPFFMKLQEWLIWPLRKLL